MKWKCFFSHNYYLESATDNTYYEFGILKQSTFLLEKCSKCGILRTRKITGNFAEILNKKIKGET